MNWLRTHLTDIIAAVIIVVFVAVWLVALVQTWTFDPTEKVPKLVLAQPVVIVAGAIATAIGSQTSAALGFVIAEVKVTRVGLTIAAVAQQLKGATVIAVFAYLAVGIAVLLTWMLRPASAPELVSAFALSLLGWLLGAGSVVFQPTTPVRARVATGR